MRIPIVVLLTLLEWSGPKSAESTCRFIVSGSQCLQRNSSSLFKNSWKHRSIEDHSNENKNPTEDRIKKDGKLILLDKEKDLTEHNIYKEQALEDGKNDDIVTPLDKLYMKRTSVEKKIKTEKDNNIKIILEEKLDQIDEDILRELINKQEKKAQYKPQNLQKGENVNIIRAEREHQAEESFKEERHKTRLETLKKEKTLIEKLLEKEKNISVRKILEVKLKEIDQIIFNELNKRQLEDEDDIRNIREDGKQIENGSESEEQSNEERKYAVENRINEKESTPLKRLYKERNMLENKLKLEKKDSIKRFLENALHTIYHVISKKQTINQNKTQRKESKISGKGNEKFIINERDRNRSIELETELQERTQNNQESVEAHMRQPQEKSTDETHNSRLKKLYDEKETNEKYIKSVENPAIKKILAANLNKINQNIYNELKTKLKERTQNNESTIPKTKESRENSSNLSTEHKSPKGDQKRQLVDKPMEEVLTSRLKKLYDEKAVIEKKLKTEEYPVERQTLRAKLNEIYQKISNEMKKKQQNEKNSRGNEIKDKNYISEEEDLKNPTTQSQENSRDVAQNSRLKKLITEKETIEKNIKLEENFIIRKLLKTKLNRIKQDISDMLKMQENTQNGQRVITKTKEAPKNHLNLKNQMRQPPEKLIDYIQNSRLTKLYAEEDIIKEELKSEESPFKRKILERKLNKINQNIFDELTNSNERAQNDPRGILKAKELPIVAENEENRKKLSEKFNSQMGQSQEQSIEEDQNLLLKELYNERAAFENKLKTEENPVLKQILKAKLSEIDHEISNELKHKTQGKAKNDQNIRTRRKDLREEHVIRGDIKKPIKQHHEKSVSEIQSPRLQKLYAEKGIFEKELKSEEIPFVRKILETKLNKINQDITDELKTKQQERAQIGRKDVSKTNEVPKIRNTIEKNNNLPEYSTNYMDLEGQGKSKVEIQNTRSKERYDEKTASEKKLKTDKNPVINQTSEAKLSEIKQEKSYDLKKKAQEKSLNEKNGELKEKKVVRNEIDQNKNGNKSDLREQDENRGVFENQKRHQERSLVEFQNPQLKLERNHVVKKKLEEILNKFNHDTSDELRIKPQERAQNSQRGISKVKGNEESKNNIHLAGQNEQPWEKSTEKIQSSGLKESYGGRQLFEEKLKTEENTFKRKDRRIEGIEAKPSKIDELSSKEQNKPQEEQKNLKELKESSELKERENIRSKEHKEHEQLKHRRNETIEEAEDLAQKLTQENTQNQKPNDNENQVEEKELERLMKEVKPTNETLKERLNKLYIEKRGIENNLKKAVSINEVRPLKQDLKRINQDIYKELKNIQQKNSEKSEVEKNKGDSLWNLLKESSEKAKQKAKSHIQNLRMTQPKDLPQSSNEKENKTGVLLDKLKAEETNKKILSQLEKLRNTAVKRMQQNENDGKTEPDQQNLLEKQPEKNNLPFGFLSKSNLPIFKYF